MATHAAATCSLADVQAAYALCDAGDIITVPAGDADWTQLAFTKCVSLIGAGIGQTNIRAVFSGTAGGNANNFLVYYLISAATKVNFRISGFSFDHNLGCEGILITNNSTTPARVRIDHISQSNLDIRASARTIETWGIVWGVVDNSVFYYDDYTYAKYRLLSPYGYNQTSWQQTKWDFGSADNLYFEDNTFYIYTMPITGGQGGRYCLRHNNFILNNGAASTTLYLLDSHGNYARDDLTPYNWSAFGVEFYENTIDVKGRPLNILDLRGGKALVYNNYITNGSATAHAIESKCREENSSGIRGHDSLCPPAENSISGQPQHVSDYYTWNTYKDGVKFFHPSGQHPWIQSTVDYADPATFGYDASLADHGVVPRKDVHVFSEVASFNGSTGMGSGLLAARPATCTLDGAAYWATDTSTLYRWKEGAWSAFFTPYTYPHPMREESYPPSGDPILLTVSGPGLTHAATKPTLIVPATDTLTVGSAILQHLNSDNVVVLPIEPTPWDIRLGPLGSETTLPVLNWQSGSPPELPVGTTAYIDKVPLVDGGVRFNFRTYSPRKWTLDWARLTAGQVAVFEDLAAYNEPLHYQNRWVSSEWHWVIITGLDYTPTTATFTTGTPFYKLTLALEEII
jgi:hypothetical protein